MNLIEFRKKVLEADPELPGRLTHLMPAEDPEREGAVVSGKSPDSSKAVAQDEIVAETPLLWIRPAA